MLHAETADPIFICPPDAHVDRRTRPRGWERVLHGDGICSVRGARGTFGRDGGGHRVLFCARAALVAEGGEDMSCSENKGKGKREKRRIWRTVPQPPTHLPAALSRNGRDGNEEKEKERIRQDKPRKPKKKKIQIYQYHIHTQTTHNPQTTPTSTSI